MKGGESMEEGIEEGCWWREQGSKDRWRAVLGRGFEWMKPPRRNLSRLVARDKEPSSTTTIATWRIPEGKFTLIKTVPVMSGVFSCVARARNSLGLHSRRTESATFIDSCAAMRVSKQYRVTITGMKHQRYLCPFNGVWKIISTIRPFLWTKGHFRIGKVERRRFGNLKNFYFAILKFL